ncbi:MAG: collagen-like protein [Butyrivibrio sp.]|nr:collagen-like protein [Butyrivibrio sp.]
MRTYVQLGWLSSAINYVFDKVISPLISAVLEMISDGLKWLFNEALGPLLEKFYEYVLKYVIEIIMRILGRFFYRIEVAFLKLVDMMQNIFNVLAGTAKVVDNNTGKSGSLLTLIATSPFVIRTLLLVIAVSVVLCTVFAIAATLKSMGDMGASGSKSVGHVLRKTSQAMLRMILAPALGIFLILLGDAILVSVTRAMTLDANVTIARSIFTISTLDALDEDLGAVDKDGHEYKGKDVYGYNYSTRPEYLEDHPGTCQDYGLRDKFREPFYTGVKDYSRATDVDPTFNMGRIDFLVGIGSAILFVFLLGTALFVFTSRMFDVIVLLMVEPFFISSMPLDDGEHFKKWEDMFLGKLFSGYGMVVAMYLYLLITSMVFDGKLSFTPQDGLGDIMTDMLMKIILLIGGAATVMQAGPLVTSILSGAAAQGEAGSIAAGMSFTGKLMDYSSRPGRFIGKKAAGAVLDAIQDRKSTGIEYQKTPKASKNEKFYDRKSESSNNLGNLPGIPSSRDDDSFYKGSGNDINFDGNGDNNLGQDNGGQQNNNFAVDNNVAQSMQSNFDNGSFEFDDDVGSAGNVGSAGSAGDAGNTGNAGNAGNVGNAGNAAQNKNAKEEKSMHDFLDSKLDMSMDDILSQSSDDILKK